jgi:arylsulfatase A-like enzyme
MPEFAAMTADVDRTIGELLDHLKVKEMSGTWEHPGLVSD